MNFECLLLSAKAGNEDAGIGSAGLEGETGAAQVLQFVDFPKMEKTGLLRPV